MVFFEVFIEVYHCLYKITYLILYIMNGYIDVENLTLNALKNYAIKMVGHYLIM